MIYSTKRNWVQIKKFEKKHAKTGMGIVPAMS